MWNRQNKTDRQILATAMMLLIFMLYLLYDDSLILPSDDTSNLTPIGKISQMESDVRRKLSKQFLWRSAHSKDTLHVGDSLFTGRDSVAHVELKDGRTLTLQENSLIVFNTTGDQLNLDLHAGRIQGKLDGCVRINIKGESKEVCGENSPIEVDSDGLIDVKKETEAPREIISWVQEPSKSFFHYKNNTPLKLSWKTNKKFGRYRVQLSRQDDFQDIAYEEKSLSSRVTTRGYPVNGKFFIRIQGDNLKGRAAGFSKPLPIEFREIAAPLLTLPQPQQKFQFLTDADGELLAPSQVPFKWKYPLKDVGFDLEISTDQKFTEVLLSQKNIKGFEALSAPLAAGNYFARVRDAVVTHGVSRPWSPPVPFSVQINPPVPLPAPRLLTKDIKYIAPADEPLKILWTQVSEAQQYFVEVSPRPDFVDKQTVPATTTDLTLANLAPGKAYFRVYAATEKGTRGLPSTTGVMHVKLKRPELSPLAPLVVQGKTPDDPGDPQTVDISWTDLKYADSYQVEISSDADFKQKTEIKSALPSSPVPLPRPGDYYVRVRGLGFEGKPVTRFSEAGKLTYTLKVPLATPEILEPFDQVTLFFQKNLSPFVWLEWKAVRQASQYSIEVATDAQFQNKVVVATTSARRYMIKERLPAGTLYWRVQAQGDDQRVSFWTQPRSMTIFTGRAPAGRGPAGRRR